MNRSFSTASDARLFVEVLEPRIAPAGLLNELKFTSITAGGSVLLDASDPNGYQGITTGTGPYSGTYLLYITAGKALVYTSDLNGNGKVDFNEITGISAGVDSNGHGLDLISFVNINGDIATNLLPGRGVSALTDSDNNPANGRDGRVLLDNGIHSITLRTLTSADIDTTVPGNTVANRLALTSFSIFGNIYTGGDFGADGAGLTIDNSGTTALRAKFTGVTGSSLYISSTPQIGSIYTGTSASNQYFHFGESSSVDIQGTFLPFTPPAGQHGGDIIGVQAASSVTTFSVGTLETGNGGMGARGGNLSEIVLHGDQGSYQLIAGDGGQGATGAQGGSIINFSDLGTVNSTDIIHSGAGGVGLLGAGGTGGTVTFADAAIASELIVSLGDGGNGFTQGGDGASQPSASFLIPEGAIPVGGKVIGTYHQPGDVGNLRFTGTTTDASGDTIDQYAPRIVDFNGDGFGDIVYATSTPDQIVIMFGNGHNGFKQSETIRLDAPGVSSGSIAIGDFNGDGRPDIVAASGDPNSFAGIYLFINQIGDSVHNPLGGKIYTGNPLGNHPFSSPLQTPLPSLNEEGLFFGRSPVLALAAGDFNGDGILDVGVAANYSGPSLSGDGSIAQFGVITILFGDNVRDPNTGAIVFNPVTGKPEGAGYFVANLAPAGQTPSLQFNIAAAALGNRPNLKATAVEVNSGVPDILVYSTTGAKNVMTYFVDADPLTHLPPPSPLPASTLDGGTGEFRQVDTNRTVGEIALQDFVSEDFALTDLDGDGVLDVVAISNQPAGFIVTLRGAVDPATHQIAFTVSSDPLDPMTGKAFNPPDNAGIQVIPGPFATGDELLAIAAADSDGNGIFDQFGILSITGATNRAPVVSEITISGPVVMGNPSYTAAATDQGIRISGANAADDTVVGLDTYYPVAGIAGSISFPLLDTPSGGYGFVSTNLSNPLAAFFFVSPDGTQDSRLAFYETNNGIFFNAGNGGNSLAGVAGNGGVIGTTLGSDSSGNVAGSIQVVFPVYKAYMGDASFTGGNGGNGFAGGGIGGDVKGVSSRPAGDVIQNVTELMAGNGGNGISGDGGRGGDLSMFSTSGGDFFQSGDGGTGLHGGRGGSIIGNQTGTFYDTASSTVTAIAGDGGDGSLGGGAGGSITNFLAQFPNVIGGLSGDLTYLSGSGGSAAGGDGGAGGSITDSSPDSSVDTIAGVVSVSTGHGGNGLTGGAGGVIKNFLNQPTDPSAIPSQLYVIAGYGGVGVTGPGGVGGVINNFNSNALGLDLVSGASELVRVVAGAGGASYGGVGGAGGSIESTTAQAVSSPIFVASGAGGAGLTQGGDGGSISDSNFNSASQVLGKVLVIAGAGGDASSVAAADVRVPGDTNTNDLVHTLLAFGGPSGLGGNGGNINNFTQPISVQTAVDMIAGNGGSTLNYGISTSNNPGVGVGGSITGVNLAGTVGDSVRNPTTGINPPIISYTDLDHDGKEDESLATLVRSLSGVIDPALGFIPNSATALDNFAAGNVGIVAGIAGRVQNGAPPLGGVNGSVQNVAASSFMSIIAGSVDNVAPVATVSGLTVKNIDGVLGADKSLPDLPPYGNSDNIIEYFDTSGRVVSNLQPGYRLIDGAIYAMNIVQPATPPNIAGPRVFAVSQGG